MNLGSIFILMAILVLLIGCTCLGNSSGSFYREGMSEGQYIKEKARKTIERGDMAENRGGNVSTYNDEDYITQDANTASHRPFSDTPKQTVGLDNAVASQREYERQQMSQATERMQNAKQGIPRNQIPNGDEDLYILKSEIVPPVCPACPTVMECPKQKKCEPCPPCGRCPEPAFECKKVPNYKAVSPSFLPKPILTDFSQFGL